MKIENVGAAIRDLEIAQLKQGSSLVFDQELKWRLNLMPPQPAEKLAELENAVDSALEEELRRAAYLLQRRTVGMLAHLIFYAGKDEN